jgi:hypothetical protein
MSILERHPKTDLLRYLDGGTEGEEKHTLEEHLAACAECREYLSFVKGMNQGLDSLSKEELTSDEPCPASWTLVAYQAGKVDEDTARHLRAHLLFCDACAEEFYALRRVSQEESWRELVEQLKEFVIDLAKSYGPAALIGPVRIVAEQPALAARGGDLPEVVSKVLEVQVGGNTYSIELKVTAQGVACDIAGFRTTTRGPLNISVHSKTGEELISTESDEFGNSRFVVPKAPGNLFLLMLNLQGIEQQVLFRVSDNELNEAE